MRPRFRLQNLFWLTLVTALVVSWQVDHSRQAQQIEDLQIEVKKLQPSPVDWTDYLHMPNQPSGFYTSHYYMLDVF